MYLSKLEIFGFKSFAHKVNLQFNDGITAVIGPNGCGKSNIVDAIRWVLGEQRPSLLRLDRMENVIFNGTASRKPLSLSDVSLYIENTKNILPSIYTEVKITRRLYRSGDSEYLINNRQVRLKDIIDLFTDTGMGSDAYSVIELKMVEQILSENAEERRRLFEEAAGIKKYKFRRKSAMRKLENTDQELVRLNDVISEVQKTVNSLSRQVGKARRYHQFKDELKQKELFIYQLRIRASEEDLVPLRQEFDQVRQTRERLGKEVNQNEAELEKLQAKSIGLESSFREVAGRLNSADEKVREIQEKVRLNEQKIESLNQNIEKNEREIAEQKNRIGELNRQLEQISLEKTESSTAADQLQEEYKKQANLQVESENRLELIRRDFRRFREENVNTLSEISEKREKFQAISLQKKNLAQQAERLSSLRKNLETDLKNRQDAFSEAEQELKSATEDAAMYEKERDALRAQVAQLEKESGELGNEKNSLIGEIEKLRNRRDFLHNLIHNYEGFSQSVQYVMSKKKSYAGLIDTLANMVDTREEYRPALESYLAEIANYLVVEEVDTARSILDEVRDHKKGRLTLVPLSLLETNRSGLPEITGLNGETTPLKNVVQYDAKFEKLFNFLFDRVILVKDMDAALRLRKTHPTCNFLTLNGEFLGEWGHITGGNSNQNLNLTGRKQQLERAEKELLKLEARRQELEEKLAENQKQTESKRAKIVEFEKLLKEQQQMVNRLEQQFNQQRYEIQRSQERLKETVDELDSMARQVDELSVQESQMQPEVAKAEERQRIFVEEENRLNAEVESADEDLRQISRQVQQLQIDYLQKKNYLNELDQKTAFTETTLAETGQGIEQSVAEIENYREDIKTIEAENNGFQEKLDGFYQERDGIEKEKLEVENSYQNLKSVIMAREEEIKKLHRRWNQALERLRELELRIQEIEVKRKTLDEQMEERFGEEFEALLAEHKLDEELSLQQVQEEIAQLREKIEALGEVNPLAIKEHEKEKERLDFLRAQENDLLAAKKELLETISKLNKTARKLFLETFEKINDNFKNVFGKFFEGGQATLRLVENGDPLETNIDISVHIKGRQLSTLTLMSAGEKTLTAISLLFAIYLVKPSPFCILDEVDAPLDDVNISRYTHALKEFSRNTQFILVTHNKMTMQSAQAMYGITMEEPGVSKVVSVRFD